jgi:MoaA/NifB/PqqE/SkfB family radical SAM enzyme
MLDGPVQALSPGSLTSVDVYISSQCNRRCTYCFLPAEFFSSGVKMDFAEFAGIVEWSQRNGVSEITLLGGEPSLHRSFADMVGLSRDRGLKVRVVTNGHKRFRQFIEEGTVRPGHLSRVAVSFDSLDPEIQDSFRGAGAWHDATETIKMLKANGVLFDINVTAVRSVLDGLPALIDYAEESGCRRINIHWPSSMGIGYTLDADEIPDQDTWQTLTRRIAQRADRGPDFFVEIERGFLEPDQPLANCALVGFSNLQIMPDGRAFRCGLLADQAELASLVMAQGELRRTQPDPGEEELLMKAAKTPLCDGCPVTEGRRACIYDKISTLVQGEGPGPGWAPWARRVWLSLTPSTPL